MSNPVVLIVEETIQRAYKLDLDDPAHAELVDRVLNNPLERPAVFAFDRQPPPALLGKRAAKGNRTPWISATNAKGNQERLDPDAEHAVNSMMTLLHVDEKGKAYHQVKVKRTTIERGPVKA